jgi:N-acetylneuraminic acid mutarotase
MAIAADHDYRRRGHTSHIIDGNLYTWDGPHVDVLDLSKGKWGQLQYLTSGNLPLAIYDYSSAVFGQNIFYFGGYSVDEDGNSCYHNSLHKLNVETKSWSIVLPAISDEVPMKKSGCGMAAIRINEEDHLVVIGGYGPNNGKTLQQHKAQYTRGDRVFTNEVHYYQLSIGKWMSIKSSGEHPLPCRGFTVTSLSGNKIIMFGGRTANGAINDIYIGHCSSSTIDWEKISLPKNNESVKWPKCRWGHAATLLDEHHLLVVGGYEVALSIISDCWIFDISKRMWQELSLPQIVTDRCRHSLSAWNINSSTTWAILFAGLGSSCDTSVIELSKHCNIK